MKKFPEKLRVQMDRLGYNQKNLADHFDRHPSIISTWLRGLVIPTVANLVTLAKVTGRTVDYYINDDHDVHSNSAELTDDERVVLQGFREAVKQHGLTATQAVVRMHAEPLTGRRPPTK